VYYQHGKRQVKSRFRHCEPTFAVVSKNTSETFYLHLAQTILIDMPNIVRTANFIENFTESSGVATSVSPEKEVEIRRKSLSRSTELG
jgi:hypothetical protein